MARRIIRELNNEDIQVRLDEDEMKPGESLLRKIGEATGRHDVVIALISSQSVMTDWVRNELSQAIGTEIGGRRFTVFPVVINTCEVPPFLAGKLGADLRDPGRLSREIRRLTESVAFHIQKETPDDRKSMEESADDQQASQVAQGEPVPAVVADPKKVESIYFGFCSARGQERIGQIVILVALTAAALATAALLFLRRNMPEGMIYLFPAVFLLCSGGFLAIHAGRFLRSVLHEDANLLMALEEIRAYAMPFSGTWFKQYRLGEFNKRYRMGHFLETTALLLIFAGTLVIIVTGIMLE